MRRLPVPLPRIGSFRLRLLFRAAFLLLVVATVALALYVLQEEKQLSYRNYQYSFLKTKEQISAKLRHPAGQLALLNPPSKPAGNVTPLHPLLLPFSALDFDDQNKVEQAVEMAGCLVRYKDYGALCVAVGSNPWAGGFIYVAGSFASNDLVAHQRGDSDLSVAHRARVSVSLRGQTYRWLAPYEAMGDEGASKFDGRRGRLTGFVDTDGDYNNARPVKEFRGWVWQNAHCIDAEQDAKQSCKRNAFFSMRLPVAVLRDALFQKKRPVWPPEDLSKMQVHVEILPPGTGGALLDSNSAGAVPPFSLNDLTPLLLPGETLRIRKMGDADKPDLVQLAGIDPKAEEASWLVSGLIRRLPVETYESQIETREEIATPLGNYEMTLKGDVRSVNKSLSAVATRVSWFVIAMLLAIFLAWIVIEIGIIRRITLLTKRAASVSRTVKGAGGLEGFSVADLRGVDELGVLASCLHDLLQRVKEDVERDRIRTE